MTFERFGAAAAIALLLGVAPVHAETTGTAEAPVPKPRFGLRDAQIEAVPEGDGRLRIRARFAPEESAGELRERGRWTMVARLAKAGASCDASAIFSDGFE